MNALYKHRLTQKWEPYAKKPILPVFNLTLKYFFFTPYEWIKVFGWFLVKSASVLSAISWADLLEVTCKQQATGSSRAWPTPKDDLSRSVLYLHYVSIPISILMIKNNFKYPGQLVKEVHVGQYFALTFSYYTSNWFFSRLTHTQGWSFSLSAVLALC